MLNGCSVSVLDQPKKINKWEWGWMKLYWYYSEPGKYAHFFGRQEGTLQQIILDSKHQPWNTFPAKSDHADTDYKAGVAFLTLQSPFHRYTKAAEVVTRTWIISFWRYGTAVMASITAGEMIWQLLHSKGNKKGRNIQVNDDVIFLLPNTMNAFLSDSFTWHAFKDIFLSWSNKHANMFFFSRIIPHNVE